MSLSKENHQKYIDVLEEELIVAFGCTEPIAIAYATAKAREILGAMPDKIVVECSGNIVKNVKGVVVPSTKNLKGISAAAVIGAVGGKADLELEVLSEVTDKDLEVAKKLLENKICKEKLLKTPAKLHIIVRVWSEQNSAMVEILHTHTGIVQIEKNNQIIFSVPYNITEENPLTNRDFMNVSDIHEFAKTVEIEKVSGVLARQVKYNSLISKEGLKNDYGSSVGKTLVESYGVDNIKILAQAGAAAGSDARMGGCELPVVINSGSGNQGITVSLPVITYARSNKSSDEDLYRALCISNLVAIHQKTKIGRLSAYCGVVSAGAGAGAGIVFLQGGTLEQIEQTITTTLANVSGIVCDGAKPSCAAKIASSVNAALLAVEMSNRNRQFHSGEGLVKNDIEKTISTISTLAKKGMSETDNVILELMLSE